MISFRKAESVAISHRRNPRARGSIRQSFMDFPQQRSGEECPPTWVRTV